MASSLLASKYKNFRMDIKRHIAAFKLLSGMNSKLSSTILIENLEQLITEDENVENETVDNSNESTDNFHESPHLVFPAQNPPELPFEDAPPTNDLPPPNDFPPPDDFPSPPEFERPTRMSWELTCLNVLNDLELQRGAQLDIGSLLIDNPINLITIRDRLTTGQYESPMDFHEDLLQNFQNVGSSTHNEENMAAISEAFDDQSVYLRHPQMAQLLSQWKTKTDEAFKRFQQWSDNPLVGDKLKEADRFIEILSKTSFRCTICNAQLNCDMHDSRLHVKRVHFKDRFNCPFCSKKEYTYTSLKRHKLKCPARPELIGPGGVALQAKDDEIQRKRRAIRNKPVNILRRRRAQRKRKQKQNGGKIVRRKPTADYLDNTLTPLDLKRALSVKVKLDRLSQFDLSRVPPRSNLIDELLGPESEPRSSSGSGSGLFSLNFVETVFRSRSPSRENDVEGSIVPQNVNENDLNDTTMAESGPEGADDLTISTFGLDHTPKERASIEEVRSKIETVKSTGLKRHKCLVCHRNFAHLHSAVIHIRVTHFEERRYFCGGCDYGFYSGFMLRRHERSCGKGKNKRSFLKIERS